MEITNETRLIDMTVGQLKELFASLPLPDRKPKVIKPKRMVYGIAGIAQIFNCSMTTANRIKASGKINQAISQCGRTIAIDADKALELININNNSNITK